MFVGEKNLPKDEKLIKKLKYHRQKISKVLEIKEINV